MVARPLALVRDARLYDKRPAPDPHPSVMYETARTLVTDRSESVEAWGRWKVWDGMSSKAVEHGKVASVLPKEQAQGAGRSELDDEESVSRVFADSAGKWISEALEVTTAAR